MFPRRPHVSGLAVSLAALALSSCDVHVARQHPPPPPPYYDLWEIEPNDAACCPDGIGDLYVGDAFVIGGTIRDDSGDPYDGFALQNREPLDLEFILEPIDSAADLDLCVWDPRIDDYAFCFDSPASVESGRFSIPASLTDFQLVVVSYSGDAEYRLHVFAHPITFGALASATEHAEKDGRAVPLDGYFGGAAEVPFEEPEHHAVASGAVYEVDDESGQLFESPLWVREDGLIVIDARRRR
jgi:hypothetical protein